MAKLILEVASTDNPPLHLAIGTGMPETLEEYANQICKDTEKCKEKAEKTSFDD